MQLKIKIHKNFICTNDTVKIKQQINIFFIDSFVVLWKKINRNVSWKTHVIICNH